MCYRRPGDAALAGEAALAEAVEPARLHHLRRRRLRCPARCVTGSDEPVAAKYRSANGRLAAPPGRRPTAATPRAPSEGRARGPCSAVPCGARMSGRWVRRCERENWQGAAQQSHGARSGTRARHLHFCAATRASSHPWKCASTSAARQEVEGHRLRVARRATAT